MIAALDSSYDAPAAADADAARAAGVRVWCGYLATRAGVGLAAPWTQLAFENARRCGGTPIAFCSGWDDPKAVRAQAAAWGVLPCLDVEPGIRDVGPWTQPWLLDSGAGLYGVAGVHLKLAAFHILADYPCTPPRGCDPGATWPGFLTRPGTPCGWQWQGTHSEFGRSVDRLWLDDWFGGGLSVTDSENIARILDILETGAPSEGLPGPWIVQELKAINEGTLGAVKAELDVMKAELDVMKAELEAGGSVDGASAIARIEAALKTA